MFGDLWYHVLRQTKDFLAFGGPLQVVLWFLATVALSAGPNNWWISWVGTFSALVLVVMMKIANPFSGFCKKSKDVKKPVRF